MSRKLSKVLCVISRSWVLEDLTEPQGPPQNVVLEGGSVRGAWPAARATAGVDTWLLLAMPTFEAGQHKQHIKQQHIQLRQPCLTRTLRENSEVRQIWNEWRPLPFANHCTSRRTATINRLTEFTMRAPVFVSTVAIWASAATGSHLQTSCLNQCSEAQKEFAVAQGNRGILCACNSIFLEQVDGCFTCLVTQDVWRYLTPWVAPLMYCNPRKEECLA